MRSLPFRFTFRFSFRVIRIAVIAVLLITAGCQRQLPPELPYDPVTAESLKKDFDDFAESDAL